MRLFVKPGRKLLGEAELPGDKSISHRAALFASLAEGESRIDHFLVSGVTRAMLNALTALGVEWELEGERLLVRGKGPGSLRTPASPIDCGNSGTTMRLLTGALAGAGIPAVLDGTPGLRARPMRRIVEPLRKMGVRIKSEDGRAPLQLGARHAPLKALDYSLPVASAQVKSCLLLASLAAKGSTTLREPGPSRDHTERMLSGMGVTITSEQDSLLVADPDSPKTEYITRLTPPDPLVLKPLEMSLPGDFSSAAFLIVAALIASDSHILLRSVGLNPTRTGLLDALLRMGADITIQAKRERGGEPVGDLSVRSSTLTGTQVHGELVVRMIDEFPAFSIAAAFAKGESVVSGAEELRHKESDRISALCAGLRALGINVQEKVDGFKIQGGGVVEGGIVDAHGDHRLGMAFSLAGLAARDSVEVQGAQIMAESFPEFTNTLRELGADLEIKE